MPTAPKTFRQKERRAESEAVRGTKQQRGYGGEWKRISLMKRTECPLCEMCGDAVAVDVDHIVPFRGMTDPMRTAWSNLQSVCRACHNGKTRRQ